MLGQLADHEIEALLKQETIGRVGAHADGRTYVVPTAYAYEDGAVYAHTADGLKLRMMRSNPHVCFEVDHLDDLTNWRSVIAWGHFEELRGADADRAMTLLLAKLLPQSLTSQSSVPPKSLTHQFRAVEEGLPAVVYRIVLTQKSGRFERR